ncbi:cytochrome [Phenylobacterium sp. Root77]|uniref:cytochrome P450 n=1 Tax=unclassified Phenylobacterium TaxID=2640670 RepID=UPI0006F7D3A6|nr:MULTISPECIES: cytochrome P450 [unclassified Phenylobacterium]KQW68247.1 cytochrome [Phenylobacterium sp. Root1277]KQW91989.1 cytochrome [Phenylobacterium sp. Root1290]KRC40222.1 cytochrome [Phenylobacterium sp. Root77]
MSDGAVDLKSEARAKAYALPLDEFNMADPELFRSDTMWPYFERLRKEDPVHYHKEGLHEDGPYWSVTKYNDIMAVDTNHEVFSSEPSITIFDPKEDFQLPMFIAMDPPKHDVQRKTVSPIVSPANLHMLEPLIRERICKTLDSLPIGEEFDWVDKVSIELTTQMLATLFDFPWEERRKLTRWSDVATAGPESGLFSSTDPEVADQERKMELFECVDYFTRLWNERVNEPPKGDLISMLAHGEATRNMDRMEYLGNLILLIVGGNDTTRNTMTGSVLALHQNPDQKKKLYENPALIPSMVSETIRWQTPLAHMRRTLNRDFEFQGKQMKKGDKVIMWYVSGNRDEEVIDRPNDYIIDRERPRNHMSFGFGIHRCVGNRLAELQLKILWEEIIARFPSIEVQEEPRRVLSSFVKGYEELKVIIPSKL